MANFEMSTKKTKLKMLMKTMAKKEKDKNNCKPIYDKSKHGSVFSKHRVNQKVPQISLKPRKQSKVQ